MKTLKGYGCFKSCHIFIRSLIVGVQNPKYCQIFIISQDFWMIQQPFWLVHLCTWTGELDAVWLWGLESALRIAANGHNGLQPCRTTQCRQQNHSAAAPSVPRDPRPLPLFLPIPSPPPPPTPSPLCSDSHTTLLCRSLSVSTRNSCCSVFFVFFFTFLFTKPLSCRSLDFWVSPCTLAVKAPLRYPNPDAPIN